MDRKEFFEWLETCQKTCEWDITNIDEGIITINFYVDETKEEE
tara:strand:+ start:2386 stop:2514 length:129 start_codon:yes stop_codon:yes gene_type:complete